MQENRSFFEKIFYKYECVGTVIKDGKTYNKYVKKRRFRNPGKHIFEVAAVVITIITGMVAILLMRHLEEQSDSKAKKDQYPHR